MDNIKLLNVPYGATELKAVASKNTFRGFISAIVIYAFVAGGIIVKSYVDSTAVVPDEEPIANRIIYLDDMVPPSINEPEKPEEVIPQKNVPLKDDEAMTPEPVKREEAEIQTTRTQDELDNINQNVDRNGEEGVADNNQTGTVGTRPETPEIPEEEIIKPPEPPKSEYQPYEVQKEPSALNLGRVQSKMAYPEMAIQQEIEGRVTVKVLVGKDGSVMRIGGMTGNSIFHDEVRDNIESLRFEPAIVNGKPVNCWVTVPFTFKIKNSFK